MTWGAWISSSRRSRERAIASDEGHRAKATVSVWGAEVDASGAPPTKLDKALNLVARVSEMSHS